MKSQNIVHIGESIAVGSIFSALVSVVVVALQESEVINTGTQANTLFLATVVPFMILGGIGAIIRNQGAKQVKTASKSMSYAK